MFENETVGPCLVQKLKWGKGVHGMNPLHPPARDHTPVSLSKDAKMQGTIVFHGIHLFHLLYENLYMRKNRYSGTIFRSKFSFYTP